MKNIVWGKLNGKWENKLICAGEKLNWNKYIYKMEKQLFFIICEERKWGKRKKNYLRCIIYNIFFLFFSIFVIFFLFTVRVVRLRIWKYKEKSLLTNAHAYNQKMRKTSSTHRKLKNQLVFNVWVIWWWKRAKHIEMKSGEGLFENMNERADYIESSHSNNVRKNIKKLNVEKKITWKNIWNFFMNRNSIE